MHLALRHKESLWKGAVAGAAGGLVASFAMNQFQALVKSFTESQEQAQGKGPKSGKKAKKKKQEDDATVKTASAISEGVFDHPLEEDEKKIAGPAVHYAFGAVTGSVYGALSERWPRMARVAGLPFGAAVWLGADEIAVPAFGLSKPPTESPAAVHVQALAAHAVYGLTTEAVRRLLRRVL